jgi:hypothetical protein
LTAALKFIPISAGRSGGQGTAGATTTKPPSSSSPAQLNFVRIWDQNDGFALTVEGHFDAYRFPDDFRPTITKKYDDPKFSVDNLAKGTQMNQRQYL